MATAWQTIYERGHSLVFIGRRKLWDEPLRVAGEHRSLPDVVEGAEQHYHSLQAHSETTMRRCAIATTGRGEHISK
jgi:hypothetical protein